MALELGLRTLLLQRPAIVALVTPQTVGKPTFPCIFNEFPPEGIVPPFILIHLIDFDPMKAIDGTSGMTNSEIDIDCYAATYEGASNIAYQVTEYLKDFTGMAGPDDRINSVLWNSKRHDRIQAADGRDMRQHIISLSFEIFSTAV